MKSAAQSVATIEQFLNKLGTVKTAASDGGTAKSEPGSIGGETEHPVKKVDDRLHDVKEGERFKENTKDVNEDQGAPSVQKAPEAKTAAASIFNLVGRFAKTAEGAVSTPGSAADDHISTTTTVSATGEDPKNETGSAKAGKEDKKEGNRGGTSHPASTANNEIDGHKWAADTPLEKLSADMSALGNQLLTVMHGVYQNAGVQAPQVTKTAAAQAPAPAQSSQIAFQAGHELAGLLNGTFDKRAADAMVHRALYETVKKASDDADMFIHYANNFFKRAEGDDEAGDPMGGGGGAAPPGGGGDPAGGGGAMGGGGDPGAMLGALGGGEDGGGGGMGGDPMGGGGGAPDHEAMQLAAVLEHLGVTPEELQQAMEAEAAGGGGGDMGGGGAPPGGGMPGGGGGALGGGMEAQASAGARKGGLTAEKTAEMTNYIRELASRSRLKK